MPLPLVKWHEITGQLDQSEISTFGSIEVNICLVTWSFDRWLGDFLQQLCWSYQITTIYPGLSYPLLSRLERVMVFWLSSGYYGNQSLVPDLLMWHYLAISCSWVWGSGGRCLVPSYRFKVLPKSSWHFITISVRSKFRSFRKFLYLVKNVDYPYQQRKYVSENWKYAAMLFIHVRIMAWQCKDFSHDWPLVRE